MKNQLPVTSWEPDTEFVLVPRISSESGMSRLSKACLEKLHQLKERITSEMASRFGGVISPEMIRQAVNEADAIAASLPFPSLIMPTLAEEKVQEAARWNAKQRIIESRSWKLAA